MSVLARDYGLKVISGGQIGADLAGLRAAQSLGLVTGGTAPRGYRTLKGPQFGLAGFGVVESTKSGYPTRTEANVKDADTTIIYAMNSKSAGTALTIDLCKKHGKPCHVFELNLTPTGFGLRAGDSVKTVDDIAGLMQAKHMAKPLEPFVLNIAGNSSDSAPRIFVAAFIMLVQLLDQLEAKLSYEDPLSQLFHQRALSLQQMHVALRLEDVFDPIPELDPRRASVILEE